MRGVDERAGSVHCKSGGGKVEQAAGAASGVMTRRVENSGGFSGMSAKGRRPALRDGVEAAEEARISADACEASGVNKVDQNEGLEDGEIREVALLQSFFWKRRECRWIGRRFR